jgi:L-serine dehydratase
MNNLRYKSVFDIIGPVMIGPSSSHTAGACRIGMMVRSIFGELPERVEIHLYESFAKTYRGHGTDVALVAGILGMEPDDERLRIAPKIAAEQGMKIAYVPHGEDKANHPNTARMICRKGDKEMTITGISIGGGLIQITELNGFDISITPGMPTLVVISHDVPGIVAKVTGILMQHEINIAQMNVTREATGAKDIIIMELDGRDGVEEAFEKIKQFHEVEALNFFS